MCRLFGYITESERSVADLLGEDGLEAFTALTAVHDDGWGAAWCETDRDGAGSIRTTTSPQSAAFDPHYADLMRRPVSSAGIVHLRWATGGFVVRPENTHPFFADDYAFAHNGHVFPRDELEALLTPEYAAELEGDTDSERYFRFVQQKIAEIGDEDAGVTEALATLIAKFPECSLNALLLGPERIYAIHMNSRADSPLRALRAMFDDEGDIPPRHTNEYFAMDYRVREGSIEIVSSGLDQPGWTPVPADTAVRVDLATREITRLDPIARLARDHVGDDRRA